MPIYESACPNEACELYAIPHERYAPVVTDMDPPCKSCSAATRRIISGFAIPLSGDITSRYVDRSRDGSSEMKDGAHWVVARNTPDGKPKAVFIETFQQQREFCKQEGIINPSEMPSHSEINRDGKGLQTAGMPGCWV